VAIDHLSQDIGRTSSTALLRTLRYRWYAVVAGVVLGIAAAAWYTGGQPVQFRSTASVLVTAVGVGADQPVRTDGVDLDTELLLVRSEAIAQAARVLLKSHTPVATLVADVQVTVPPNTQVLAISYVAPTGLAAQQGAHAFAQAYITVRSADAKTNLTRKVDALESQVTVLETRLRAVAKQIADLPSGSTDAVVANAERSVLINQISTIEAKAAPLRAAPTVAGVITSDAVLPHRRAGATRQMNYGSGALLGLLLGLCLGLLIDRLDARLRDASDVERRLRLPVLSHAVGVKTTNVALAEPSEPVGQSLAELRSVLLASPGPERRVIVVTGAGRGPAGSFAAANLAYALVRADHDVLLVCADEASPVPALLAHWSGQEEPLPESTEGLPQYRTVLPRLAICFPWIDIEGGYDWIATGTFSELVKGAGGNPDFVIIDAPSVAEGARTQSIVLQGDTSVVVVEARRTTVKQVSAAHRKLERMGVRVQGVVVVPHLRRRSAGFSRSAGGKTTSQRVEAALAKARGN
jgi:polysaccharide biosynthesis transport protein